VEGRKSHISRPWRGWDKVDGWGVGGGEPRNCAICHFGVTGQKKKKRRKIDGSAGPLGCGGAERKRKGRKPTSPADVKTAEKGKTCLGGRKQITEEGGEQTCNGYEDATLQKEEKKRGGGRRGGDKESSTGMVVAS